MEINFAGFTEPASKLIDAVAQGIGGYFRPRQIRELAAAEGDAQRTAALARRDVAITEAETELVVAALREDSARQDAAALVNFAGRGLSPLHERAMTRLVMEEGRRQGNLEAITRHALKRLPGAVNDVPVDPDWSARFVTRAKEVSQEDMQALWGEVLAREVAGPGAFSLATLDVLADLTRKEAELFERLARWSLTGGVPFPTGKFWSPGFPEGIDEVCKATGVALDQMLLLEHHRLLKIGEIGWQLDPPVVGPLGRRYSERCCGGQLVLLTPREETTDLTFSFSQIALTPSGREIAALIQTVATSEILSFWVRCFEHDAQPGDTLSYYVGDSLHWQHTW